MNTLVLERDEAQVPSIRLHVPTTGPAPYHRSNSDRSPYTTITLLKSLRTLGNSPSYTPTTPTPKANPRPHIGTGPNEAGIPDSHTVTHSARDADLSAHSGMVNNSTTSPLAKRSIYRSTKRPWPRLRLIADLRQPTAAADRLLSLISMVMITQLST
jgi:hypothetical protein